MRFKKRKKSGRMRGTRTHGWAMKKHKGSGNRGGKGFAGTGKRADQKKSLVIKLYGNNYFGKQGITSKRTAKKRRKLINLKTIAEKYKPGEIDLKGYKILGDGEIKGKYFIKAKAASQAAIEKVKKEHGDIILK